MGTKCEKVSEDEPCLVHNGSCVLAGHVYLWHPKHVGLQRLLFIQRETGRGSLASGQAYDSLNNIQLLIFRSDTIES